MRSSIAAKAIALMAAGLACGPERERLLAAALPLKPAASATASDDERAAAENAPSGEPDVPETSIKKRKTVNYSERLAAAASHEESTAEADAGLLHFKGERRLPPDPDCPEDFVICNNGQEVDAAGDPTGSSCSAACNGDCCTSPIGDNACGGFTGKVCRDGSCDGSLSCDRIVTDVIKGCKGTEACQNASPSRIVDSCEGQRSCYFVSYGGSVGNIIGSCKGKNACYYLGRGGVVGHLTSSCNGYYGCYSLAYYGFTGDITNSCNNANACNSFVIPSKEYSNLYNCCNDASECANISSNSNIPSECAAQPPGPDSDKLVDLEENAASLAFSSCDVTFSLNDVQVQCTFDSTDGVDATAQILEGTCSDNNEFNNVSSSAVTSAATVTATLSFVGSITAEEKNSGSITKQFCSRADVFANDNGTPVSIGVQKVNVEVTLIYSSTGTFTVSDITVAPVEIVDSSASATRNAQITAELGPCGGSGKASYAVGERLEICISSEDTSAEIENIKSVSVTNPSTELVDENGVANALTVIGSLPAAEVTLGTLVIADYDDSGTGSIEISGTADINFVSRRMLNDVRVLQDESTSEKFFLVVPLTSAEMPDVVDDTANGVGMKEYGISATALLMGVMGIF